MSKYEIKPEKDEEIFWPKEFDHKREIPKEGCWIMVIKKIPIAYPIPLYDAYWAFQEELNTTKEIWNKRTREAIRLNKEVTPKNTKNDIDFVWEEFWDEQGGDFGITPTSRVSIKRWNKELNKPEIVKLFPHEYSIVTEDSLKIYLEGDVICPVGLEHESQDVIDGVHVFPVPKTEEFEEMLGSLMLDGLSTAAACYEAFKSFEEEDKNYYFSCVPEAREMLKNLYGER